MMSFSPSLRAAWIREGQSKWRGGFYQSGSLQAPLEDEVRGRGRDACRRVIICTDPELLLSHGGEGAAGLRGSGEGGFSAVAGSLELGYRGGEEVERWPSHQLRETDVES